MGLGVTTQKLVEIHESSDENEEEGFGVVKRFIEVATYVYEITDITQKEVQPQMAEQ